MKSKVNSDLYLDKFNKRKTWLVCHMNGAKYLKQFIDGIQQGKGLRCNLKYIKSLGILDFKKV